MVSLIFMKFSPLNGLFKIFSLFFPFYAAGQANSVLSRDDSDNVKENRTFPRFINSAANPKLEGNGLRRLLVGQNYRNEWTQPVRVPVLNFKTSHGGLVAKKLGGGKETRSLNVEDSAGKEWALRSVEKFPENVVPPELRRTVAAKIVDDAISASYPYGALSMGTFSRAAGVPFFKDTLVYVATDEGLGEFRSKFENLLVLMEEKSPSEIAVDDKEKKEKLISTEELVYELQNHNGGKVDQLAVLRARLLDNFVMDFDRHEGQWEWLGIHSEGGKIYYPIPKDRDQVFYSGNGILTKLVAGKNIHPETQGFRAKTKNIITFNRAAQNFDRVFLNELSEDDWNTQIDLFLPSMTDALIDSALHKQPAEIQKYSVKKLIASLKEKRKSFKEDMMRYYRFLAAMVTIVGTNQRDQFLISKQENGEVEVVINKIDSSGNVSSKLYDRRFDPAITKEIRIYGLEGNDKFVMNGGESKIKIRLIGGPGDDEFISNGSARNALAYDVSFEQNVFSGQQTVRKKISGDPQNNTYTRLAYRPDVTSFGISLEYSRDGGLYIGPKLKIIKQGFRKEPYSMSHLFAVNRALNASSYHIKYNADFIRVFGNTDLLFRSDANLPTSRTLFFGIGNNSIFDQSKPGGHKFYLARYDLVNIALMARSNINSWFHFRYGPVFQYFKLRTKENANKYISEIYPDDGNSKVQYVGKSFAGGEVGVDVDTRNDPVIPTRGTEMNVYNRSLAGLNNSSHPVNQTGGDLSFYTDFISRKHVVIATSFGASHITGNYEWEQAQYLGYKQNLRGFRIDRFAGRSRVYNNFELRLIKTDANLILFRGSLGLVAFNDVGRVWADKETSTQWHDGYGWGIFIAPLNRLVITASLMYSKEEKNLALINFGFQF